MAQKKNQVNLDSMTRNLRPTKGNKYSIKKILIKNVNTKNLKNNL